MKNCFIRTLTLLLLTSSLAFSWTFTQQDFNNLSKEQMKILDISYLVGSQKGFGATLATIALVETRASVHNDLNDNHICGVHQIDINYADILCETVASNPYISALLARDNFLFWYNGVAKQNWSKALIMYNGGYRHNPHGKEYLRRINLVYPIVYAHYNKDTK